MANNRKRCARNKKKSTRQGNKAVSMLYTQSTRKTQQMHVSGKVTIN